jgi:hypothetical protein
MSTQVMTQPSEKPPLPGNLRIVDCTVEGNTAEVTIEADNAEAVTTPAGRNLAYEHRNTIGFGSAGLVPYSGPYAVLKSDGSPIDIEALKAGRIHAEDMCYRNIYRLVRSPI